MVFDWPKRRADREIELGAAKEGNVPKTELQQMTFPWGRDGEIAANLAIGTLRDSLLKWLKTDRGVHAETLMVAVGAIAGFAAQNAVWQTVARSGKAVRQLDPANLHADSSFLFVVARSGEKFYVGELLNGYLAPEAGAGATIKYPLWNLIAATALEAGVSISDLPDLREMFRYVSKTVGTDAFAIVRAEAGHQPGLSARQALKMYWPYAKLILGRTDELLSRTEGLGAERTSVAPEHWPIVVALVAKQLITLAKDTLNPRQSVALSMESAIAASKVDPDTVPQNIPQPSS
jgi:hypothetical protein